MDRAESPRAGPIACKLTCESAKVPERRTVGAGGYDLTVVKEVEIPPMTLRLIQLDYAVEIPSGYVGLILPRCGVSLRCSVESGSSTLITGEQWRPCSVITGRRHTEYILVTLWRS